MTQPETQSSLGYVIERVEKLEVAIIKISERMEMLDTIQRDKYKALQKQVDDQLDGRNQVNKAYGEMFANLQKQIELLTIKT